MAEHYYRKLNPSRLGAGDEARQVATNLPSRPQLKSHSTQRHVTSLTTSLRACRAGPGGGPASSRLRRLARTARPRRQRQRLKSTERLKEENHPRAQPTVRTAICRRPPPAWQPAGEGKGGVGRGSAGLAGWAGQAAASCTRPLPPYPLSPAPYPPSPHAAASGSDARIVPVWALP